ncbi:MAG: hypothetical protein EG825_11440 [Rhodocyclaceae bacterium]|nr:hypothetical protein [Rhodocyclaceae bacterium]
MRLTSHLLLAVILCLALLTRGVAWSHPMPADVASAAPTVATHADCADDKADGALPVQDDGACRIVCDLAGLSVLPLDPLPVAKAVSPVQIPRVSTLSLIDATPPDQPPPRR